MSSLKFVRTVCLFIHFLPATAESNSSSKDEGEGSFVFVFTAQIPAV
jgi:hypothetical protein